MVLDGIRFPLVLAPLAGGPSTPELAAAVTAAGGLGFLAGGYLTAVELAHRMQAVRRQTDGPLAVNLFVPGAPADPTDPPGLAAFLEPLRVWAAGEGLALGEPRTSDDDWEAKLELLAREPPAVVSFTFGCPAAAVVDRLHGAGSEVWVTVTCPDEAVEADAAGADVLVVQGAEAGGHRASFVDRPDLPVYGLLALLSLVRAASATPLVAGGGIATGGALAAVLVAGARAAQVGTAFLLCPEAGTSPPHRRALRTTTETALTRAFTGRLARGIRNRFLDEHTPGAPLAYPQLHYVTAPVRARAREEGNGELINLWAGETHALAREEPAAEVVRRLVSDAQRALDAAAAAAWLR